LLGGLAETESGADLHPVIFDGAATPLVLQELLGGHADLLGDKHDNCAGHILFALGEASFDLEALQQDSECYVDGCGWRGRGTLVLEQMYYWKRMAHARSPTRARWELLV